MYLNTTNNTAFEGKYIFPTTIKTKVGKYWKNQDVNFVKVDTRKNAADVKTLEEVEQLWEGQNLSGEFNRVAELSKGKANIYVLTTQTNNLEKLEADKILGMIDVADIRKKGAVDIYRIATNPKYAYAQNTRTRDKKHIAKELVNSVKKMLGPKAKAVLEFAEATDMPFCKRIGLETRNNGNIYTL